jgi:trans-aconitate methyltransferase
VWQEEVRRIYDHYAIYHQGQGAEQSVFDATTGQPSARSARLVERWSAKMSLPERGRLVDIGCGNGALLRAFSAEHPNWSLSGVEVNDHYKAIVEGIPHVEQLYTCPATDVPGTFDAITLVHALEHIPAPRDFLLGLWPKVAEGGLLLIQVPDCRQNPFMLLVADHASHFFVAPLREMAESAGYEVLVAANDWVAKEITVIARKSAAAVRPMTTTANAMSEVIQQLDWLAALVRDARALAARGPLGIFGTSVAATWLQGELNGRAEFFVDEDPNRPGQKFMGRKILRPSEVREGSRVVLALPTPMAEQVNARLSRLFPEVDFFVPQVAAMC